MKRSFWPILLLYVWVPVQAQRSPENVRSNYNKREVMIPMRDGTLLYTAIYTPKEDAGPYPIIMVRTPYSCNPYGPDRFPGKIGPNKYLEEEKYIFVHQDVRGRYKSGGTFQEMTPALTGSGGKNRTDESTDTYDTIEWLLKNSSCNGRVGLYGISYPGFYASAALPNAHPALAAVSPQAPVTDEFIGDDCYHNGAFFLMDNFGFYNYFDGPRNSDSTNTLPVFDVQGTNAYEFFLRLGAVKNSNGAKYFNNKGTIYSQALLNDTYNDFWQVRNIRTHLKEVKPAVLVVGGWFDAEDLFGALQTYKAIETQTPGNNNRLVMGPWTHGGWSAPKWNRYATYDLGQDVNLHYQRDIETPFFNYHLKGKGNFPLSEATVFETGSNEWRSFPQWPPAIAKPNAFYFHGDGQLKTSAPTVPKGSSSFLSDPADPVPYTQAMGWNRNNDYLGEDQRFLAGRKDVLRFETPPLDRPMELLGPVQANLFVNSTGSDADFIVKLIDVFPPSEIDPSLSRLQQLVRAEVFRGKFRKNYSKPEAFIPGKTELVAFTLNDVAHVFKPGHRIMVQVQSSWFPLVDRNPQQFLSIPLAKDNDYRKATITLQHNSEWPSHILLPIADK